MSELITPEIARQKMLEVLAAAEAEFHQFVHRPIRNFDDAELARQESGFVGTETKSMVLRSGDDLLVYITVMGKRIDLKAIRAHLGGPKPKMVGAEELWERFAAEPGAAYPFGFDSTVGIYVDPVVFDEDWLLMSLVLPTETLQLRGGDFRKVLASVPNKVEEVTTFNQSAE